MQGYNVKDKKVFLAYELLGCAFLTLAFNLLGTQAIGAATFVCSIWAWQISCAHFNYGVTLASFVFTTKGGEACKHLSAMGVIMLVQTLGAGLGIFLTYVCSTYVYSDTWIDQANKQRLRKTLTYPAVPTNCPSLTVALWKDRLPDGAQAGCNIDGIEFNLFLVEFLGSFMFYMSYLISRNYQVGEGQIPHKWTNIMCPLLLAFSYAGSQAISGPFNGYKNPLIAMEVLIWSSASYSDGNGYGYNDENKHLHRFAWIYILAPLIAALLAGFLGRIHFNLLESGGDGKISEMADPPKEAARNEEIFQE